MKAFAMSVAGATGINGDAYYVNKEIGVFCVVDGASGSSDKQLFCHTCLDALVNSLKGEELVIENTLAHALREANRLLISASQRDGRLYYGTMTMAVVEPGKVSICSVGDSPAFLLRKGSFQRIDQPGKRYQTLVDLGIRTKAEIEDSISRLLPELWSVFETFLPVIVLKPEVHVYGCNSGDIIALCSDGVSDYISPEEMYIIVERCGHPEAACNEIIAEVKRRCPAEKQDDMTVVLAVV